MESNLKTEDARLLRDAEQISPSRYLKCLKTVVIDVTIDRYLKKLKVQQLWKMCNAVLLDGKLSKPLQGFGEAEC